MSVEQLRDGVYWLAEQLYSESCETKRRQAFFDDLWRQDELAIK